MVEGATHIIVNFRDLEYISSAGLQTILATAKKLENSKGEILWPTSQAPLRKS